MKVDFNEENHEYSVGGIRVPSVSEILLHLNPERYGDLNPWMLKSAAARGTAVHEACELIDYGEEPEENAEIDGYLKAYTMFLLEHDVKWELVESVVGYYRGMPFDDGLGELPLYCGTVDRFGLVDGLPSVVDIKTYASMNTDAQLTASCQTRLYEDALESNGHFIMTRYILHLRKDGTYRLIDLAEFDKNHGFDSHNTAWHCYEICRELRTARKKVKKTRR